MTDIRKRVMAFLVIAVMLAAGTLSTVYADQPYRGTVKHKSSLRNADVGRAENTYTDLDGRTQDTDKDTVSISFTSDMEQNMELYSRVATYFDNESKHYPRSFMIDAGNYSNNPLYGSVFSQYYPGIRAMGEAGYDIIGIGSSELAQGGDKLTAMLNKAAGSDDTLPYVTSANISGTNDLEEAFKKYGVNDYLDMNKYRTEIAVISVVGEDAFNAAGPDKLRYESAVKTVRKLVDEIKKDEDADMIMCLVASGIGTSDDDKSLEKKIAESVDDIDMIISAGSDTELEEPLEVNGARIFSLAAGEGKLGRIEYVIEDNSYKYSGYSTVELDDTYKEDKDTAKVLSDIAKTANKNYFAANGYSSGQVLCDSFFEIAPISDNAGKKGDSPLGELIADAFRFGATEDAKIPKGNLLAIASDLSAVGGISEGRVTVNMMYDMLAVGRSDDGSRGQALTSFYLTGKDVKLLAEIAAVSSEDPSAERLYFSGLSYKYNPYRFKDSRVYDVTVLEDATGSQIELQDDTVYRIITDKMTAESISGLSLKGNDKSQVIPKDENGQILSGFGELNRSLDKDKPLKTWIAASEYMASFQEAGIPATYKKADSRMKYDDSKAFSHVYKGEFFTLIQLLIVALIGVIAFVVLVLLILNLAGVKVGGKRKKQGDK